MNPDRETGFPEELVRRTWGRLSLALREFRPVIWLAFLLTSLVLFLIWLPAPMRMLIWHGLVAQGLLSSMLLVFSLLAISLIWSAGQRVDVYVFLFFNLRGKRPVWLDKLMLGVTQIGAGLTALGLGLILLLGGYRLVAYELVLGTLTLWIVVELLKALVRRTRPIMRVTQARIVGLRARGRSFPSGHTSQVFFWQLCWPPISMPVRGWGFCFIPWPCWWGSRVCMWARIIPAMYWRERFWGPFGDFWGCW